MANQKFYCRQVLLNEGWRKHVLLTINATGIIKSIDSGSASDADTVLNGPVIPGMPNLHSHGFQRLIGGLTGASGAAGDDFWGWRKAMYGFANRISAQQFEDCLRWVYVEMLKAGYTSCAEFHYLHHQPDGSPYDAIAETSFRVLSAADSSGISVTLLPVFYKVSGFGQTATNDHQRRFVNGLDNYLEIIQASRSAIGQNSLHKLGIAPHSLRAVPADQLRLMLENFAGEKLPVHIHIAEQMDEVTDCMAQLGQSPVNWLLNNVQVDQNWCLVHATHMDNHERKLAALTGAVAGLCPTTEADLGDGFFDSDTWLKDGGSLGIGTDSNLRISVSEELRLLEFTERLRQRRRDVLRDDSRSCGRFLYEHAARSGAQALGQNVGTIKPGCRADLVELDPLHPQLEDRRGDTVLDSFVFAGGNEMIRTVFVGGNQVISEGCHASQAEFRDGFVKTIRNILS